MKHILFMPLLSLFAIACSNSTSRPAVSKSAISSATAVQADDKPGECPYLTKDNKGNTVLSWVRMVNDSTTAFCYAVHDGNSFSRPVVIPNSGNIQPHGENLPKIIFKPSGEIIALWGAAHPNLNNKYSGQVFYTCSFDEGKSWTKASPLVTDTGSYDQRYYDVALLPDGEAGIIWLDNRKRSTGQGSGLYFASTRGRKGFGEGRLISQPCCPCCRTNLFVDKKGGIHALFRGIIQDSIRDMVHILSTDGGKSFSQPKRISEDNWVLNACPHTGPAMTENKDGIHFAWYTGANRPGCYYTRSTDNGNSFVSHEEVNAKGSHPQLAALQNGELLIVWDEASVENNKIYKKIGIQRRNPQGHVEETGYITDAETNASYPVISALKDRSSLIAYTTTKGHNSFVMYQVVK